MLKRKMKSFYLKKKLLDNGCTIKYNVKMNEATLLEQNVVVQKNCNIMNTKVGIGTYLGGNNNYSNCIIGKFTSIAPFSEVIYGNHPTHKFVSTHPAFFSDRKQAGFSFVKEIKFGDYRFVDKEKKISSIIGNDVWIGYGAKIIEGTKVGDGAVIGAGAIVTKDVEPYSIVVGVPAKKIGYRFSKEHIEFLINFKWWDKDFEWIKKNSDLFENIEWFYKKYKFDREK